MYFQGEETERRLGADAVRRMPPVETARQIAVPIGAGKDAHRVMAYHPFTALQGPWMEQRWVGNPCVARSKTPLVRTRCVPTHREAHGFSHDHDEDTPRSLEVGKLADLAVLTRDYMTVPVNPIGTLESLLTMVGGKIVYAAGPLAKWETPVRH